MFQLASAFLSLSTHAPDTGSGSCEQFFAIKIFCSRPLRTKKKEGQKVTEQLTSSIFPLQRKTLETRQQSAKMHRDADGWMRVSHSNWLCSLFLSLTCSLLARSSYSLYLAPHEVAFDQSERDGCPDWANTELSQGWGREKMGEKRVWKFRDKQGSSCGWPQASLVTRVSVWWMSSDSLVFDE